MKVQKQKKIKTDLSKLNAEYQKIHPIASRFIDTLTQELYQLFSKDDLSLGVPIECRVKTLDSIIEKITRLDLSITSIKDIDDLIGLRIIMLFKRDLNPVHDILTNEFGITNKRVLIKTGFIQRNSHELLLNKIEAIQVNQGILGRMFGYGTIAIVGTGGTRDSFSNIVNSLEFRKQAQEQISKAV